MNEPNLGAGDNPAARLYKLFTDFRGATVAISALGRYSSAHALSVMWGLDWDTRPSQVMRLAADAVELPDAVMQAVEAAPENPFLVKREILSPFPYWEAAVGKMIEFVEPAENVLGHITSSTQENLRYCARLLGGVTRLPPLPTAEMADLMDEANTFLESVLAADLPPELRSFVVEQIEAIREALLKARTAGAEALLDQYAVVASRTYRRRSRGDVEGGEAPGVWHRLRLLVHELGIVAALASDLTGAPANIVTLMDAVTGKDPAVILQVTPLPEGDQLVVLPDAQRPALGASTPGEPAPADTVEAPGP